MGIDNKLFVFINSYEVPEIVTEVAIYLHGYKNVEVAFFLFCLILTGVLLGSPKKGIRASVAVFIAAMCSYFGAQYLRGVSSRPFPYLDENLASQLRVEPLPGLMSAFPISSIVLFSSVAVALIYYFPKYSLFVIIASIVYTLMPIHLGVALPSDAFGSLLLGYAFSYFMMTILGKKDYFKRY